MPFSSDFGWCSLYTSAAYIRMMTVLHGYAFYYMSNQCRSRSAGTCMHLHWFHLGQNYLKNLTSNSDNPDQTAPICKLIWIYTVHLCNKRSIYIVKGYVICTKNLSKYTILQIFFVGYYEDFRNKFLSCFITQRYLASVSL
jgi:hypothetical protein